MKKEYTKPNMEIVSFTPEDVITASGIDVDSSYQTAAKITTINY